jgi:hypothetical protein
MSEHRDYREIMNAITAGSIETQLSERRVKRGTQTDAGLLTSFRRIRAAFDHLTEICSRDAQRPEAF